LTADLNLTNTTINERYDFALKIGPLQLVGAKTRQYCISVAAQHALLEMRNESCCVFEIVIAQALGDSQRVLYQPQKKVRLTLQGRSYFLFKITVFSFGHTSTDSFAAASYAMMKVLVPDLALLLLPISFVLNKVCQWRLRKRHLRK
jgi:hypothetical protein